MCRERTILTAVLACTTALASAELHAQARGPPLDDWKDPVAAAADPAATTVELAAWLPRLVKKFRYEGTLELGPLDIRLVKGFGDCKGIGDGPGVHCVLNLNWPEIGSTGGRGPESNLTPAMILYGLDPGAARIRFMQVDDKGLAETADGAFRSKDTLKFLVPCVNSTSVCRRVIRIKASADGAPVDMQMETWSNYFMDLQPGMRFMLKLQPVDEISMEDAAKATPGQRKR